MSVWLALLLREALTRLFNRRAARVWLLLEPAFHIGVMVFVFTVVRVRSIRGIDTVVWLVLGFLGFSCSAARPTSAATPSARIALCSPTGRSNLWTP